MTAETATVAVAHEHTAGYEPGPVGDRPDPRQAGDPIVDAVAAILVTDRPGTGCDGELAELSATLRAADRLLARAVTLAGKLDGRRAAREEGMTVDAAVRLHSGAAPADVATVLTAGQVLTRMPIVAGLFASGVLSWGHIRAVTTSARRFDVATRAALDGYLGGQIERLAGLDPDRQLWALDDAIDRHRPDRTVEARTERQVDHEFLALQGRLDGTGSVYGEFGPESFATLTTRLDAEADTPRARPCPSDQDGDQRSGQPAPDSPDPGVPTRGQQLAAALLRLCARPPGRTGGSGPARVTVVVDLDRLTDTAAGEIATGVRGRPPRIVRRALDRVTCDSALDVVVRDGTDLLAAQRYAPDITAAVRRAVHVRDGGCRFPGCTAPTSWCDLHHVTERARGGDHAITNLVALCRRHHTTIHRQGWHQTLRTDGTYTIRRRGRTWTTLPRRDQQLPPPDGRPRAEGLPPDGRRAPPDRPHRSVHPGATDPPQRPDPPDPTPPSESTTTRAGPADGFPF